MQGHSDICISILTAQWRWQFWYKEYRPREAVIAFCCPCYAVDLHAWFFAFILTLIPPFRLRSTSLYPLISVSCRCLCQTTFLHILLKCFALLGESFVPIWMACKYKQTTLVVCSFFSHMPKLARQISHSVIIASATSCCVLGLCPSAIFKTQFSAVAGMTLLVSPPYLSSI